MCVYTSQIQLLHNCRKSSKWRALLPILMIIFIVVMSGNKVRFYLTCFREAILDEKIFSHYSKSHTFIIPFLANAILLNECKSSVITLMDKILSTCYKHLIHNIYTWLSPQWRIWSRTVAGFRGVDKKESFKKTLKVGKSVILWRLLVIYHQLIQSWQAL